MHALSPLPTSVPTPPYFSSYRVAPRQVAELEASGICRVARVRPPIRDRWFQIPPPRPMFFAGQPKMARIRVSPEEERVLARSGMSDEIGGRAKAMGNGEETAGCSSGHPASPRRGPSASARSMCHSSRCREYLSSARMRVRGRRSVRTGTLGRSLSQRDAVCPRGEIPRRTPPRRVRHGPSRPVQKSR